jgi:hypothetical protein
MAVKIKIILDIKKLRQTIIAIIQTFMQFRTMILTISKEILPPHSNLVLEITLHCKFRKENNAL